MIYVHSLGYEIKINLIISFE